MTKQVLNPNLASEDTPMPHSQFAGKGKIPRHPRKQIPAAAGKNPEVMRRDKKRHQKAVAGEHITENDMIRLARRAGITRIAQCIYPVIRKQMTEFTQRIVKDALAYVESSLDDKHKAEMVDKGGNIMIDEARNFLMKSDAPTYGGTIGIRPVMESLKRNNFKMYWHKWR